MATLAHRAHPEAPEGLRLRQQLVEERQPPPNPAMQEPEPEREPEPARVDAQQPDDVDDKEWQDKQQRHTGHETEEEEEKAKEQQQKITQPLRSALLSPSRHHTQSLPDPPFDRAKPPSSTNLGARPRVSSLVNGRTPKITCLYDPGAELGDLALEPPVRSRNLGPFCIGAIASIASARYLTWQQTRNHGVASMRMLRALVWFAHLVWCGSSSAELVLRARTHNRSNSRYADATRQQSEWPSPRCTVPTLNLDKLSPPIRDNATATFSQQACLQAGHFIGGAASGVVWMELLGGHLRFADGGTAARQWAKNLGALHRVLTMLFYSTSGLLAQWHVAAATVSDEANETNWGSRSKFLRQIAVVLHLAELPHFKNKTAAGLCGWSCWVDLVLWIVNTVIATE